MDAPGAASQLGARVNEAGSPPTDSAQQIVYAIGAVRNWRARPRGCSRRARRVGGKKTTLVSAFIAVRLLGDVWKSD